MKRNFAGPPVMKNEIQKAIRKMKSGKATGPEYIIGTLKSTQRNPMT